MKRRTTSTTLAVVAIASTLPCAPPAGAVPDAARPDRRTVVAPARKPAAPAPKEAGKSATTEAVTSTAGDMPVTIDQFLDRLMIAESGGRDTARNPRSTALGPYQFIASTWLHVMRAYFPKLTAEKSPVELLSLRTDRIVARKAAAAYTRELATVLRAEGLSDSFVNLRLAYLLGPSGSIPILKAKADAPVAGLVSRPALRANPFLARLTVGDLKDRAKRELALSSDAALNLKLPKGKRQTGPKIRVRCNLARASCKRWLALEKRKLRAKERRQARAR